MIRFVTGTGIGVGKTAVCAVLARDARQSGLRVGYLKAVQTGIERLASGDAEFVRSAAGVAAVEALRFPSRLDPAVAGEQAAASIALDWLVDRTRAQAATLDVLYVEGTGGLLAPLSGDATMADFALRLGGEVVIVTRPGPGMLNLAALTLEATRTRSLHVAGFVVNRWPLHPGVLEHTNLERLRRLAPVLGVLLLHEGIDTAVPTSLPHDFELR